MHGLPHHPENYVSGGQIENFREGWAKHVFSSGGPIVHYFRRDGFDAALSLCRTLAPVRWLYGPGNIPKCKRCVSVHRKHGARLGLAACEL